MTWVIRTGIEDYWGFRTFNLLWFTESSINSSCMILSQLTDDVHAFCVVSGGVCSAKRCICILFYNQVGLDHPSVTHYDHFLIGCNNAWAVLCQSLYWSLYWAFRRKVLKKTSPFIFHEKIFHEKIFSVIFLIIVLTFLVISLKSWKGVSAC